MPDAGTGEAGGRGLRNNRFRRPQAGTEEPSWGPVGGVGPRWAGPGGLESVMSRPGGFVLEAFVSLRRLKIKASGSR